MVGGKDGSPRTDPISAQESTMVGPDEHHAYRRMVGQLLWLSTIRRDVSCFVNELSKKAHAPNQSDVQRGNRALRYLVGQQTSARAYARLGGHYVSTAL